MNVVRPVPTVLFLTHRRGTALAVWDLVKFGEGRRAEAPAIRQVPNEDLKSQDLWLSEARGCGAAILPGWEPHPAERELLGVVMEFLGAEVLEPGAKALPRTPQEEAPRVTEGLGIWVSSLPTAETLGLHFRTLGERAGVSSRSVERVVFGGGPVGSFTGLRLGASYAGGLAMGRGLELASVPTFNLPVADVAPGQSEVRLAQQPIHPLEVFGAIAAVLSGGMVPTQAESLIYSSEPGPVLTLQGHRHQNLLTKV